MEEGTLVEWFVGPGDRIEEGQVIFEIETDKAAVEVEAVDAGRIARIVVGEGETVPVKTVVAYLAESDAEVDAYLEAAAAAPEAPVTDAGHAAPQKPQPSLATGASTGASGRPKASPAARKASRERGVDLGQLGAGSGPGGRILSSDVEKAAPAASGASGAAGVKRRAMTKMRRAIAANLELSKRTIPHFYAKITLDAGALMTFYAEKKQSFKLSINDVVAWSAARCAAEFPAFRSRIEGGEMLEFPHVNLGLAVGTEEGLLVPVVSTAEELDLAGFAAEARRVVAAARAGKLEGQGKGVFTVTNLGMFGIDEFSAIINPPESAILAVGVVREAAVSRDGVIESGRVMTLTLSSDHRIIDGVMAARFLGRLRELIEDPASVT